MIIEELRNKLIESGCNDNTQKEVLLEILNILDSMFDFE